MRPNTRKGYEYTGKTFTEFFRNRKLSPEELQKWLEYVKKRKSHMTGKPLNPTHINHMNGMVRGFLNWLHIMQFTAYDLGQCLPNVHAPKTALPAIFTEEQYEAIKEFCKGKPWAQPYLWLIVLGYRTGMSLVDCCYLRWNGDDSRVHLDDNGPSYISVIRQKMATRSGEKARCQIPIIPGSDLHQWLLELKKVTNYKRHDGINDYVHQDCPGLYTWNGVYDSMQPMLRRVFKGAGIPKGLTFKNLRNSLCSNLVNSGMDTVMVCKITGHSNPRMLLEYLKPDRVALEDGMAKAHRYSAAQIKPTEGIILHETTTEDTDGRGTTEAGDGASPESEPAKA